MIYTRARVFSGEEKEKMVPLQLPKDEYSALVQDSMRLVHSAFPDRVKTYEEFKDSIANLRKTLTRDSTASRTLDLCRTADSISGARGKYTSTSLLSEKEVRREIDAAGVEGPGAGAEVCCQKQEQADLSVLQNRKRQRPDPADINDCDLLHLARTDTIPISIFIHLLCVSVK